MLVRVFTPIVVFTDSDTDMPWPIVLASLLVLELKRTQAKYNFAGKYILPSQFTAVCLYHVEMVKEKIVIVIIIKIIIKANIF